MHTRPPPLVLLSVALVAPLASAQTVEPTAHCASVLKARVNLNTASVTALQCLPGVTMRPAPARVGTAVRTAVPKRASTTAPGP